MILRLGLTCGSELDPRSYEDCDRVVVNRAEPWIQNYYLGQLCPQDIKDAKLPSAPPGAIEDEAGHGGELPPSW